MEATRVIRIFFFGYSNLEHFYFKQPQTETNPKPKQPQTRTTPNQNNPKLEPSQGTFFFLHPVQLKCVFRQNSVK